tara:strand:- start:159 stop:437 length:279 start_codon:yes stop_codon:yes gene_type:complete
VVDPFAWEGHHLALGSEDRHRDHDLGGHLSHHLGHGRGLLEDHLGHHWDLDWGGHLGHHWDLDLVDHLGREMVGLVYHPNHHQQIVHHSQDS